MVYCLSLCIMTQGLVPFIGHTNGILPSALPHTIHEDFEDKEGEET